MHGSPRSLRVLLLYEEFRVDAGEFYKRHIRKLIESGFNVDGFCITIDPPNSRLDFNSLDLAWKKGNRKLLRLYEQLKQKAQHFDVLLLHNGSGLHPDFLSELNTFNAYQCFDDPESSSVISQPVAKYFDACFVGNIASLNQYRAFGCKNVFFRPLGFYESTNSLLDNVTEREILSRKEDIDACIFCERESKWRQSRLDYVIQHVENFVGAGNGWPLGRISDQEVLQYYRRAKIGLNLHNSTGPINLRTYALPANGVMQVCDNKFHLGHLFELDKEVVGYQDIEEVPDLIRYYGGHDQERKKIAIAGWKRAIRDYNEVAIWEKQMTEIAELL